jgi:hypothetical protein
MKIRMKIRSLTRVTGLACVVALLAVGCQRTGRDFSVNEDGAKNAFNLVMTSWREGRKPTDLRSATPPVIVGDSDWESGATLVAWTVRPDVRSDGSNIHFPVEIVTRNASGAEQKHETSYVVSTSPAITVFRNN